MYVCMYACMSILFLNILNFRSHQIKVTQDNTKLKYIKKKQWYCNFEA